MAELFELTGIDTVRQRLEQIALQVPFLSGIAVQQEAEAILETSRPLVPVDTGSLRDSGKIDQWTIIAPGIVEAGVRYGGTVGYEGRVPERYAAIVEFDITMPHPRGGQSHYLSMPTFQATAGMLERIADQLRNAL